MNPGHGLRGMPHHRRLGISPDPEGNLLNYKVIITPLMELYKAFSVWFEDSVGRIMYFRDKKVII